MTMLLQKKKLGEILELEYGKPLPKAKRKTNGKYPVYGANGQKDRSDDYYFDKASIIVGRKGSAGEVNLTEEKFWPLDVTYYVIFDQEQYDLKFLYYLLRKLDLPHFARGVKPGINRNDIYEIPVEIPKSIEDQKLIVSVLERADLLRSKRKESVKLLEKYLDSAFTNMFGDPVTNSKKLEQKKIKDLGEVITGNTPPRSESSNYGDYLEWIKSDNINNDYCMATRASEYLSEKGAQIARSAPAGSILVTCIAGSKSCIGNCGVIDREAAFNQQINAIIPNADVDPFFLYTQIRLAKSLFQKAATSGMKGLLSKSRFSTIELLKPSYEQQKTFSEMFKACEVMRVKMQQQAHELDRHFDALTHQAFAGAL